MVKRVTTNDHHPKRPFLSSEKEWNIRVRRTRINYQFIHNYVHEVVVLIDWALRLFGLS